jgi:hypothetical protein
VAAILLAGHGLIEVSGLFMIQALADSLETFGSLDKTQLDANAIPIVLFGVVWGLGRLVAALGAWSSQKWALALGMALSLATLISALTIIPAGVTDTLLAIPTLACLLRAWFGDQQAGQSARGAP